MAFARDEPRGDPYGDVVVPQTETCARTSALLGRHLPLAQIDSVRDDPDALGCAEPRSKEEIANMFGDCDCSVCEQTCESLCAPDGLTPEEAVNTMKRRHSGNAPKPRDQLAVEISVQQVGMNEAWPEAMKLDPQRTCSVRIEVRSRGNVGDVYSSLAQRPYEQLARICRRRPHPHFYAGTMKSREERE